MKKYRWIIFWLFFLVSGLVVYFYVFNSSPRTNYSAQRSNLNNTTNNITNNNAYNKLSDNSIINNQTTGVETELATYSTKIKNTKDLNRQSNITITCNALNNTKVAPGETFSFCDTIGESTIDRGYKEANVIIQGTETKGLGGGNCQVSSTLYNAVLAVPNELEVVERHAHSAPVPYIEEGKDAAISYRLS